MPSSVRSPSAARVHDPVLHDPSMIYAPSPSLSRLPSGSNTPDIETGKKGKVQSQSKNVVLGRSSFGRPPWYDQTGQARPAFVIGIAGGSASGKTSVAREILRLLDHVPNVLILSQDSFYRYHEQDEIDLAFANELDFDHPSAIDFGLFKEVLEELRLGNSVEVTIYSFVTHQRLPETQYLYGASVIIVEGILALQDESLRELFDLKVFVNCDTDLMLARRIRRDVEERGRDVMGIIDQYLRFVKPSYDNFVQPSSKFADIIVPGAQNNVAVELIVTHIRRQLSDRSLRFRSQLSTASPGTNTPSSSSPPNLVRLEQTSGLSVLVTFLRDRETNRDDFIQFSDRLATLVVEKALSLLPYRDQPVTTPLDLETIGKALDVSSDVIGVSVARSGGPLEKGLRRVVADARLGSLLIHNDEKTQEPLLYNTTLPAVLKSARTAEKSWVLLLDSQIGTGASALMAIRVLLDHHVPENQILFLTFIVTPQAIETLRRAFPLVRIVTSQVDSSLIEISHPPSSAVRKEVSMGEVSRVEKEWVVKPGFGDIGDRYYSI
ncbi:armadillo/beta-catenin/plakoglobin [Mrakia frigida]|uniref:uridine kinase family protein n=1 Tax=Mrakia frigida TaxID=29902 RepID=UPI003FCC115C